MPVPFLSGRARRRPAAAPQRTGATATEPALCSAGFRAVFDDAPGAVAMVTGAGEAGGRLLRVNPAFARMLGTSVEALHLREVREITHPDDRELDASPVDGGSRTVRKRYLHSDGRPVHVEVRVSEVRDPDGMLAYLVNHIVDLDVQEASERALRDAARIRRDMVSTISHELRTPLTSVHGYLEMIAGEDFGPLTAEQKRMIGIALRNAARLEEFVADLLMLARLDAAELDPIRQAPVDLGAVVRAALAQMAGAGAERGTEFVVELPTVPVTVGGDAAHLRRAVESLLANAIKYTAEDGRVSVCVRADSAVARVEVADTGMGIHADEIGLLGNRFYRGTDAQRRAIGGTGLGLAITKTIVERHAGTLEIASVPGEGSTFTIALPQQTGGAGGA
ncbi:MAG TPA: ATP-binding protein [Jatrophihabitans sp.]